MGLGRRFLQGAFDKLEGVAGRLTASDVEKLTPAQREHYERWEVRSAALRAGASEEELGDPRLTATVLQGPAGEVVHGVVKAPKQPDAIEDPAAWDEQMRAERGARDATREPYLAPQRKPLHITRVATRGGTQMREICDYFASSGLAARPELVHGAYRVPDLISPARLSGEKTALVEWDIVHAAEFPLSPAEPPALISFVAKDVLVARAAGERAPLDEDLALDVLARAGIGPQATLGIARDLEFRRLGGQNHESRLRLEGAVRGVHLLAAGGAATQPLLDAAAQGAPWPLEPAPPPGVFVEILQWDAIARAVHPVRQRRAPLPSPFPYLPLTAPELLRAYLEIVGVDPVDSYSAQVTYDRPFDLMPRTSTRAGVRRTGGGPDLPCADGKARERMAGGHHVVLVYRDCARYKEGRQRFDAYMETELQAHLRRDLRLREPVPKPPNMLERTVNRTSDVIEVVTMEPTTEDEFDAPRYCWPPRGR